MKHLPTICIDTIEHRLQNYDTAGDYYSRGDKQWFLRVSKLPDWKMEAAIVIHELMEMFLTKANGIDWGVIDEFDKNGEGKDHPDPGTLKSAPYHKEHKFATKIEKMFCKEIGLDWDEYNEVLDGLEYR